MAVEPKLRDQDADDIGRACCGCHLASTVVDEAGFVNLISAYPAISSIDAATRSQP
jgi:hypothetical protein